MLGRGRGASRYQLRSGQALPFFVPRRPRSQVTRRPGHRWQIEEPPEVPDQVEERLLPSAHISSESSEEEWDKHVSFLGQDTVGNTTVPLNGTALSSESATDSDIEPAGESDESDVMEATAPVPSKEHRFSGRPGTQSLCDFKAFVNSMISRFKFKHGANYTALYMFESRVSVLFCLAERQQQFSVCFAVRFR